MAFFRNLIITFICVGSMCFGVTVQADDEETGWTFVPSLGYEHKLLGFSQRYTDDISKLKNESGRKSDFEVYLPMLNVSLTATHGKFYVAFKYEPSLAENSVQVDETRPPSKSAVSDPYFLNIPHHETDVKRSDQSVTFGLNVWQGLNVFAGYLSGKTRLSPQPGCYTFPLPCTGRNLASDLETEGRGDYYQQYTEEGPYFGASYGWHMGESGTLSASFALARMNGRFKDNYITTAYGDEHFNFTGDSVGTSMGLTWSAPLGESSAYFLDIRRQKYSMHGRDTDTPSTYFDTVKVTTDETMLGLTMGLQFYF